MSAGPQLSVGADDRSGPFRTDEQLKRPPGHKWTRAELSRLSQREYELNEDAIRAQMAHGGIPADQDGAGA